MKSKNEKIGLVVLAAILAISAFSVATVGAQPVEVWNVTWGGTGFDRGLAVATVGDCVYLAGETSPSNVSDHTDAFLNKYNSTDGTLIWNLTWGVTGNDEGNAIATTEASVYLAGYTHDGPDGFLNKYSSTDGTLIWNITCNGEGSATATAGDSVYLAGMIFSPDAGYVAYLNKYDKDGTLIWNLTWGETGSDVGNAIAATSDCVYLAGTINNTDGFLNKYNSTDGTLIWNLTTENASGYATATAGDRVYLAGITWTSAGAADDAFINKYDTDGTLLWNITWGGTGVDTGSAIAATGDSVYLAGGAGGSDLLGMSNFTAFLNKYNSTTGDLIWNITWGWGRPFNDTFATATATTGDNVYLAGYIGFSPDAFLVTFSEPTPTPTVTPTPPETPMPLTPTPSPTPTPPGFEAVFAIAGLLVVAFLVRIKRRK